MHTFSFEKLEVWQDSRGLALKIYTITRSFPEYEKFGLVPQMRRAAISISSNIAEGSSRSTAKDQAHFYQIAYASLTELLNQLIISNDLGLIDSADYEESRNVIEKISRKLNNLRKSRLNS